MDEGFEDWLNCPAQGIQLTEENRRWSFELDGEQEVEQRGGLAISVFFGRYEPPCESVAGSGWDGKATWLMLFIVGLSMAMVSSLAFGGPPGCQEISFLVSQIISN